jgi:hypothetical protein
MLNLKNFKIFEGLGPGIRNFLGKARVMAADNNLICTVDKEKHKKKHAPNRGDEFRRAILIMLKHH